MELKGVPLTFNHWHHDFEEIIETVSRYYNVSEKTLFTRTPGIKNHARDIAIYLFREEALIKMNNIAKKFSIGRAAVSIVVSRIKMRIQSESIF
jgi:chromosomal replication initiation ATPase DnaA